MPNLALAFDILANDRQASRTLDHFAGHADRTGRKVSRTFGTLGKSLVGAVAGFATISVFKGFIADAEESRKVARLTAQVIKTTGRAAHVSAKQVDELATAISKKTGIDDEAIASGENLLLTFTGVRNEVGKGNRIFDRATGLIGDMSVALGQDMKSGAIQLGKALNDPIKGVTALQRVGVSFTKDQRAQIKTLVDHGKTLEAQKIILDELGREFGGAAEAAATPTAKLRVAAGNLSEDIGTLLLPAVDKFATFMNTKGVPAIEGFIRGFQNGTGPGGKFADAVHEVGHEAEAAWNVAKPFFSFIGDHPKLFAEIGKDALIFAGAMKGISTVKKLPGLGSLLGGGKGGVLGGITKAAPLPVFVTNPGVLGSGPVPGGKEPVPVGVGRGPVAEGRFGKILASNLTAQVVTLADVVLGSKAASGLKNTIFPLRFKVSVNDAAKEFLAKFNDPGSLDKVSAAIYKRHFDAVFAAVAESTQTGDTTALEKALKDVDADLQAHRKQILAAAGKDAKTLETLLTGGLNRTKAYASATGKDIGTAISTGVGSGVTSATLRADALDTRLERLGLKKVEPKVDLKGASTAYGWANTITGHLNTLGNTHALPSVTLTGVAKADAQVRSLIHLLTTIPSTKAKVTVSSLITGGVPYATGGLVKGPGTGTSDSVPARLSSGEFVVNAAAARQWKPMLQAINSGQTPTGNSPVSGRGGLIVHGDLNVYEAGNQYPDNLYRVAAEREYLLGAG